MKFWHTNLVKISLKPFQKIMETQNCIKKLKLEVSVPNTDKNSIKEGQAEILVSPNENVFYNPVQEFNRDLSVAVLNAFFKYQPNAKTQKDIENKEIKILEALSATGLRSIRYAKEVHGIKKIIANDISITAVDSIKQNIYHNRVEDLVQVNQGDAVMVMHQHKKDRFDAVDLDPYGCPTTFLDAAVQCVTDGGLLLVTATDMAILAGNSPESCYVKYGAISLKSKACHEIGLRILLQSIASHAGRYGRYMIPLLSISADFYIRVFVQIFTSPLKCKNNASNMGLLYQCIGCESMVTQPLCEKKNNASKLPNAPVIDRVCQYCQHKYHVGGPIWLSSLHDMDFVNQLLDDLPSLNLGTLKRIEGVLNVVSEELDVPLYYTLDRLMSIVRCYTPSMKIFRSAILNAGYQVSYSHANKISIKTDAPNQVIWDIVRAWEKDHPAKREKLDKNSPAMAILSAPSETSISFDIHPSANPSSRQKHLTRYQKNPKSFWGPGTRSKARMIMQEGCLEEVTKENKQRLKKNPSQTNDMDEDKIIKHV